MIHASVAILKPPDDMVGSAWACWKWQSGMEIWKHSFSAATRIFTSFDAIYQKSTAFITFKKNCDTAEDNDPTRTRSRGEHSSEIKRGFSGVCMTKRISHIVYLYPVKNFHWFFFISWFSISSPYWRIRGRIDRWLCILDWISQWWLDRYWYILVANESSGWLYSYIHNLLTGKYSIS